jgi:hypothetical protein
MPETGVPQQLIEEDDIHDYAFIGDITEVHTRLSFLLLPIGIDLRISSSSSLNTLTFIATHTSSLLGSQETLIPVLSLST